MVPLLISEKLREKDTRLGVPHNTEQHPRLTFHLPFYCVELIEVCLVVSRGEHTLLIFSRDAANPVLMYAAT